MPVRIPDPPSASLDAVRETIRALLARGEFSFRRLRNARSDQLSTAAPHQVFTMGLDDAVDAAPERARATGWRYLLEIDEEVVGAVETVRQGDDHFVAQVNYGPFVRGTIDALVAAEEVAEQGGDVELRLLHLPALYLLAVWLYPPAESDADTLFVPIAPSPAGLEPNRPYASEEFFGRVRELADSIPAMEPDDLRGG